MSTADSGRRGSGFRSRFHDDPEGSESHGEPNRAAPGEAGTDEGETEAPRSTKAPEAPEQLARETVYRLLAARARSRSELMQALLRKGIPAETADGVLQKFEQAGLIDDAAFAESWVRQRHEHQGVGRRALRAELHRKGVGDEAIAEAVSQVDDDAEAQRARELVRRKLRGMRAVAPVARTRRLVAMLARKGYSEGLAFRVVREETEAPEVGDTETEDFAVDGADVDDPEPR